VDELLGNYVYQEIIHNANDLILWKHEYRLVHRISSAVDD
jgi:hypothetical protein